MGRFYWELDFPREPTADGHLEKAEQALIDLGKFALNLYKASETDRLEKLAATLNGLKISLIEPVIQEPPDFEFGILQEDGSTASLRLWPRWYEINGKYVLDADMAELSLLKIFVEHKGQPLLADAIVNNPDFLTDCDETDRQYKLSRVAWKFNNFSADTGLFVADRIEDSESRYDYGGYGRYAEWYGFAVDSVELDEDTLKRKLAGKLIADYTVEGDGGGFIKLYEYGYEIDGEIEIDIWPHKIREREFVKALLENQGTEMTARLILNNTDFMEGYADSTRHLKVPIYAEGVMKKAAHLIETGTRPSGRRRWWGVGIEHAPPPTLLQEYEVAKEDGSVRYVRVWDDGYEIDGQKYPANSPYSTRKKDILNILLTHKEEKLTISDILDDTDFMEQYSRSYRSEWISKATNDLIRQSGEFKFISTGRTEVGKKKWWGIDIQEDEGPEAKPQPVLEYERKQADGSVAFVRVWEDQYEINGHTLKIDNGLTKSVHDVLEWFLQNKGRAFTGKQIYDNVEGFSQISQKSADNKLRSIRLHLASLSGESGLFQQGTLPDARKWYGIEVDDESINKLQSELEIGTPRVTTSPWPEGSLVDHILKDEATEDESSADEAEREPVAYAADETDGPINHPSIIITEEDPPVGAPVTPAGEHEVDLPAGIDLVEKSIRREEDLKAMKSPRPDKVGTQEPVEMAEEVGPTLAFLHQVAASPIEQEIVNYVVRNGHSSIDLRELTQNTNSGMIPIDRFERQILPKFKERLREKGIKLALETRTVKVKGDNCPFLDISTL